MIGQDDSPGLDGITWVARTQVTLYGVRLGLQVTHANHLPALEHHFPTGATPSAETNVDRLYSVVERTLPTGATYDLFVGSQRITRRRSLERLARSFASDARLYIAEHAHERVFLHAGVVSHRDRAIVIPGRSLTGKTTLVAALVRAGATYYSDEYAVLDPEGWIHPFAKPLSIRTGVGRLSNLVDAGDLGGQVGDHPVRIAAVLATRHVAGSTWDPEQLSTGQAALRLLDNAVAARPRFTEVTDSISAALAVGVVGWQGDRGEADLVAHWVVEQFAKAP